MKTGLAHLSVTVGTRGYSPPEVYRGLYHKNSDVWSLGICFWILLTGTYPFNHKSIQRKSYYNSIFPIEYFMFPSDEHLNITQHMSENQVNLFKKVLKTNPFDRPSIEEVLNDFLFS